MTDLATPGEVDAAVDSTSAGHAMAKAGTGAWIVDGADIAGVYSSLDETVLNAFAYNSTDSSGLDAVIDPGEAYVSGWLCRDTQTTITLPADSTTSVYLGYDASAILGSGEAPADSANIIVGVDGDFAAEDPQVLIWDFATDGSSIISTTNYRVLQQPFSFDPSTGVSIDPNTTFQGLTTFQSDVSVNANADIDGNVDIEGQLDVRDEFGQISIFETDTNQQWNIAVSSDNLNLNYPDGSGLLQVMPGGDVENPNGDVIAGANIVASGVLNSARGSAIVSGSERHVFVSGSSPSDSDGQDGDIWIEH